MIQCKICQLEFASTRKLACHLRFTHQLTSLQYYDSYLKKNTDATCTVCGAVTKFKNLTLGYQIYCSDQCKQCSSSRCAKIVATKNRKYGDGWAEIYKKQQNTVSSWSDERKKKYCQNVSIGIIVALNENPGIIKQRRLSLLANTTAEERSNKPKLGHQNRSPEQINDSNQKRKNTNLLKYGVESHTQTIEYKKLLKAINDGRSAEAKKAIIDQATKTKVDKGIYLPKDSPERKIKKEYKGKCRYLTECWAKIKFTEEELSHRGLNGNDGVVQLDHIVSLETCFRQGISVEVASHWVNLRLIPWQENIRKSSTDAISCQALQEMFLEFDNQILINTV